MLFITLCKVCNFEATINHYIILYGTKLKTSHSCCRNYRNKKTLPKIAVHSFKNFCLLQYATKLQTSQSWAGFLKLVVLNNYLIKNQNKLLLLH